MNQVDSYQFLCDWTVCVKPVKERFLVNMLHEGYISVIVLLLCTPNLQPISLSPDSQVWYLSGWVCYLQLEKAKDQQEREARTRNEEEEEREALKEAARSYLTKAKKVIQIML